MSHPCCRILPGASTFILGNVRFLIIYLNLLILLFVYIRLAMLIVILENSSILFNSWSIDCREVWKCGKLHCIMY